jgi:hypothetical protein
MKGCLGIWAGFTPWYDTLICLDWTKLIPC